MNKDFTGFLAGLRLAAALLPMLVLPVLGWAQVTLPTTSPYTETFDGLNTLAPPAGWTARTSASATSLGSAQTVGTAKVAWNSTTGQYRNVASADALSSAATSTAQNNSTDRALGLRQSGSFGDPGAAFVLQLSSTTGYSGFSAQFSLQNLDVQARTVDFQVDYGTGASPAAFVPVGSTFTQAAFGSNLVTVNFGTALDNLAGPVWIRIAALTASGGTGSRSTYALDDFSLSYSSTATPTAAITLSAPALTAFATVEGAASASQNYTVAGANLTDDISIVPPTGYELALESATPGVPGPFSAYAAGSPLVLSQSNGSVATTRIYVRLTAATTVANSPYNGSIAHTSASAVASKAVAGTVAPPPAASIGTPTFATAPLCANASVTLPITFTASSAFDPANTFTLQLSDATGSFAAPVVLGSIANNQTTAQTVSGTIPANTASGTGYKIKVVASNPATISTGTSASLTIVSNPTVSISPGTSQTIGQGSIVGFTGVESPGASSRQWLYGTASGSYSVATGNTTTSFAFAPASAGSYYVVLRSEYPCGAITSAETQVTVTAPVAIKWDGGGNGTSFTDAQNWSPDGVPGPGADILLDHTFVAGAYTMTFPALPAGGSPLSLGSLTINPNGGAAITAVLPSGNAVLDYLRFTRATNALVIYNGGTFLNSSGSGSGSTPVDVVPTGANFIIYNGGKYVHNNIRSAGDLLDNLDSATSGTEQGIFQYLVPTGTSYNISAAGRTYGTLMIGDVTTGTVLYQTAGGSGTSSNLVVRGNLEVAANTELRILQNSNLVVGGNISALGRFKFAPASTLTQRRLVLNGTTAQTISGAPLTLSNTGTSYLGFNVVLQINNPQGVTLATDVTLNTTNNSATSGGLDLTSGVLSLAPGKTLTLSDDAVIIGGSASSFVSGRLARITNAGPATSFFPIGAFGIYRPLTLTATSQVAASTYTVEQLSGDPGQPAAGDPLNRVSAKRSFSVTSSNTTPGNFTGNITLTFGPDDYVNTPSSADLVITKRDGGTAGNWVSIGRAAAPANTGDVDTGNGGAAVSGTLKSGQFSDFSEFAFGALNTLTSTNPLAPSEPLPVELTRFEAKRQSGNAVAIAWATASEKNSAHFEVQRSLNGRDFVGIVTLRASGSSTQAISYAALDKTAPTTVLYYRLRQVDLDGTAAYSPVVTVAAVGWKAQVAIYPNPARSEVCFEAPTAMPYRVLNQLGQSLLSGTTAAGTASIQLDGLAPGLYFLELNAPSGRTVGKFRKE